MRRPWIFLSLSLLLLTACRPAAEETSPPGPTAAAPTAAPAPIPTAASTPTPEPEPAFPFLATENDQWQVYVDHYEQPGKNALLEFSVYGKDGTLFQSLSMTSPFLHSYCGALFQNSNLLSFQDLNFDGHPDLLVLYENIRTGAYDAFLWDEEREQFVEEPSFTEITGPCFVNSEEKLVFGCGSTSATSAYWSVHRYIPGKGYRQEYDLEVFSLDDERFPGLSIETRYENGEAVSTVESWDGTGLSDIWDKTTEDF